VVVSFLVEDGKTPPAGHAAPDTAVGVDRGVVVTVATSAGELLDRAFVSAREPRRVLALQRKLSRAATGSATATRLGQPWPRCGRVSVAAAKTSARKLPASWRTATPWWCWRNYRPRT